MGAAPMLSAAPILQQKGYTIPGVIVLDVVEGESYSPVNGIKLTKRNGCGSSANNEIDIVQATRDVPIRH